MRMSTSLVTLVVAILILLASRIEAREPTTNSDHRLILPNMSASISATTYVFWNQSGEFATPALLSIQAIDAGVNKRSIVAEANETMDDQRNSWVTQNIRETMGDNFYLSESERSGKASYDRYGVLYSWGNGC